MTAHKHAAMIKAKADNMDLIVFIQHDQTEWEECVINKNCIPSFDPDFNHFLCLPQHKEACLHWLNGGDIRYRHGVSQEWDSYGPIKTWTAGSIFMQDHLDIRIKPRKEKRWIAKMKGKSLLASNGLYKSITEASSVCGDCEFYEIEVEV